MIPVDGARHRHDQYVPGDDPRVTATVNVKAFGARGDGATDDTAAVTAALESGAGLTVVFPPGTYRVTSALAVAAGTTVTGAGTIHQASTGTAGLVVTGSGVTVSGITLAGPQSGSVSYDADEDAINCTGTSAASSYTGLTVSGVTIDGWGHAGVLVKWTTGFSVRDCDITDVGYVGVGCESASEGNIRGCRIDNVSPGYSSNMYGVYLSHGSGSAGDNPPTTDVVVDGNKVSRVGWEALDTHGGQRLVFSNNTILECSDGIAIVGSTLHGAASAVTVVGNVVDSLITSEGSLPSKCSPLVVWGMESGGTVSAYATDVAVTGNVFRRCKAASFRATRGLMFTGNAVFEANAYGLTLDGYNDNFSLIGNTFTDVWSNSVNTAAINTTTDGNNTGSISGNILARGTKSATYVNVWGVRGVGSPPPASAFRVGFNDFSLASYLQVDLHSGAVDAARVNGPAYISGDVEIDGALNHDGTTVGFFGTAPTTKPTVTGSRGGNAALASLLTQLAALGLLTDSST